MKGIMGQRMLLTSCAVIGAQVALPCAAQAQIRTFDIPPQEISTALGIFGLQGGVQVVAPRRLTRGERTPGVRGTMTVQEAFQRLLANTPLIARQIRPQVYSVVKRADTGPTATASATVTTSLVVPARIGTDAAPQRAPIPAVGSAPAQRSGVAPVDAKPTEEIVVTGSRVIRNGNASPTPVTVIGVDQLQAHQPGRIIEAVASLPVFSGSRVATSNPGTGVSNAGTDVLNLRDLGLYETLVLFDGHRVPPSTFDELVDIDIVPQLLLQRVDVVTGGASAVYGSDAVAGVVNFITDRKFNGLKVDLSAGETPYGDDRTVQAGLAYGRALGSRGHVELSYEYHDDPGVGRRSSRGWGRNVWTVQGGNTAAAPYHLNVDTRIVNSTFGGLISAATGAGAALNGQTFAQNGVLSPFVHGVPSGNAGYESGGSGDYNDASIKTGLRSHQLFGRFDYDLSSSVHAYAEAALNFNRGLNFGQYNSLPNVTFSGQNAFLPSAYQFNGTFKLSELMSELPRVDTRSQQRQYVILGGITGKLGSRLSWDVGVEHSYSESTTRNDGQINNQRLYAALDAVKDPSGNIVCHVTLTNPGLYPGCVPLNVFGPTAASEAAYTFINDPTQFRVTNGLDDITGSITGAPFDDWAGPVTMAVSAEARNQTYSVTSTGQPTDLANCTGLTFNCTATTQRFADATLANRSRVSNSVWEVAYEAEVPLLRDRPFARDLSLNGAIRYTNYKTSGSAVSWKLGLVWQVSRELKFRATRSRDIRAPTLYDLFQPQTMTLTTHTDQLTGANTPVPTYTSGNPNLTSEIGNTKTVGFVYSPAWLPRFSVSVDGFYIDISNALYTAQGFAIPIHLACQASGGSSPYCALQTRGLNSFTDTSLANAITSWRNETINVADIKSYGADFEANYSTGLLGGTLNLRALATWLPHTTTDAPGLATVNQAGLAVSPYGSSPKVRATAFVDYRLKRLAVHIMETWRSPLSLVQFAGQYFAPGTTSVPAAAYTNLGISYNLTGGPARTRELFLNVQNLLNKQPPPSAGTGQNGNVGQFGGYAVGDDPVGRFFTVGARLRF